MQVLKMDTLVCGKQAISWRTSAEWWGVTRPEELKEIGCLVALAGSQERAMVILSRLVRNGLASEEALEKRVMEAHSEFRASRR